MSDATRADTDLVVAATSLAKKLVPEDSDLRDELVVGLAVSIAVEATISRRKETARSRVGPNGGAK